jgi:anti-sigma28 factor (negative regulator of flagellin synthesis)
MSNHRVHSSNVNSSNVHSFNVISSNATSINTESQMPNSREVLESAARVAIDTDNHRQKLERIKSEVTSGTYAIDSKRVAAATASGIEKEIFFSKFEDEN